MKIFYNKKTGVIAFLFKNPFRRFKLFQRRRRLFQGIENKLIRKALIETAKEMQDNPNGSAINWGEIYMGDMDKAFKEAYKDLNREK